MDVELGYNEEEMKLVKETRKIWNFPAVKITGTCVRVPVMRAHAESINLEVGGWVLGCAIALWARRGLWA